MTTPDIFYFVARQFESLGFGAGGDLVEDYEDALEQYATALRDGDTARVFRVEMDADNMPAGISDMTAEADQTVRDRLADMEAA